MRQDIERAMKLGMIPQSDVGLLTAAIGGVAFSILDEIMQGDKIEPQSAARFATKLFMRGIDGNQD